MADLQLPALPAPDARGYYPAIETAHILMARKIIRRRAAKLTQAELAKRAGIRLATLQRLEAAEQVPGERMLGRIEAALEERGGEGRTHSCELSSQGAGPDRIG